MGRALATDIHLGRGIVVEDVIVKIARWIRSGGGSVTVPIVPWLQLVARLVKVRVAADIR